MTSSRDVPKRHSGGFSERSGDINVLPDRRPKVVITHDFMDLMHSVIRCSISTGPEKAT